MENETHTVTCSAPVNIAVIKYWGKRDEELVLPVNSSLSVTLNQDQLRTVTTVSVSRKFQKDRIWVNNREESMENPRLKRLLAEVRRLTKEQGSMSGNGTRPPSHDCHMHICSENNFPTAAGLASSAAGYACLAYTLCQLYHLQVDVSLLARQGSGSACRSVYGGFVKWEMGEREDGSDSIAVQVAPESHWLELEVLILVVSSEKKAVSSTRGMQTTVKTSPLMKYRCETVVPQRMETMERAIVERDFPSFARLTMQDSNQFHAVCLDSYPPILYLNDTSKRVMQLVTAYNKLHQEERVAYTFDAGPNAVLYCLRETMSELISLVTHYFPPTPGNERNYIRGISSEDCRTDSDFTKKLKLTFDPTPGLLQYIIRTSVGDGPRLLTQPLLGLDGLPLATTPPT
ncbi:Diphosphomevalonate decarboxylase [Geodia barretti]|uniref:Diphosphomevalonate decarboxylase n=1 Tax=Geodia barretti TaxID=519541 RepID=A0AA35SPJ6_GEOBA|nr:Diphosphomevalonate decarboxylase [Geodia barretti]